MAPDLKAHIRSVPDFPKPGILFYDIGSLLAHGPAWKQAVSSMVELVEEAKPEVLVAIESRGFLIAAPIAAHMGKGLVMIRKRGKLPGETVAYNYDLEYGSDMIEIQKGVIEDGQRAVVIDDLLATGGTARAAIDLTQRMGAEVVQAAFIIELTFLNGKNKLGVPVRSLLAYDE